MSPSYHLRLSTIFVSIALAACGTTAPSRARPAPPPAGLTATNQGPSGEFEVGADRVRILHGGAITFATLGGLIDSARTEVDVEMYEFGRTDMVDALVAAHRRGVAVSVIVDPTVDVSAATELLLRSAGVAVLDYPVRKLMIDHVKLMVVDGSVAVVGGINWGAASQFNHDVDAVIRGPAVSNLLRVFRRDVLTCGLPAVVPEPVTDPGIVIATTLPGADIRPLALFAINGALHTLDLELFVITDNGIVTALVNAHRRGVVVRVLLDPSERPSDGPAAALKAGGVDVRLYRSSGELLHAKFVVADGRTVLFGSANWSKGGFVNNHECDALIRDAPEVAANFETAVAADWAAAVP